MKKITRKHLRPFLGKYSTSEKVLEIGGGRVEGNHSYGDIFPNRHTFDIDPQRKPDTVGDAHKLPFDDNSFSFILCTEVFEHLHSPWIVVEEMQRVLKPGGKLILTTRFVYPIHDAPHDYYRYTKYGLQRLFQEWNIIELTPETKTFSTIAALLQRIIFQSDLKGGKLTKAAVYMFTLLFDRLNVLIKSEYGDIKKTSTEEQILTTGYYLAASYPGD